MGSIKSRATVFGLVAAFALLGGVAGGQAPPDPGDDRKGTPTGGRQGGPAAPPSGSYEWKDVEFGTGITECPQARLKKVFQEPLDRRTKDRVEQYSEGGNDRRPNEEYSCFPQNETAVDINPVVPRNVIAGANDYRLGWGSSGFYASTDSGQTWYNAITPFPSAPGDDHIDGGGDPVIAFDRAGVAYYSQLRFERETDRNGIFVNRSTNGGYTWSRPCVPEGTPPSDGSSFCASPLDPREPGDGTVVFQDDNDKNPDFSVTFHDKEWMTTGRRPDGVQAQCFTPVTRVERPCDPDKVGVDRIYVTWTAFNNPTGAPFAIVSATIEFSFSDDEGRSWSRPKTISGNAPFCTGFTAPNACDDNQFSVPTTNPETGHLYVAFENFNTPDENQILVVRSRDGGATFEGPFFVTPVFDVNMPRAGEERQDCSARGQGGGREVLTNSCFRAPMTLAIVADRRRGAFADDLYLVMSDNRNGTRASTNTDVFFFRSNDGGSSWIGPTRMNDDRSDAPANRDCIPDLGDPEQDPPPDCPAGVHTGNDQWWPWIDVNLKGHLNVVFHDRRLDVDSTAHEWPGSRQRPGNYLVWNWGAQCTVATADSRGCVAPGAAVIPQPDAPIDPGADPVPGQGPAFLGDFRNFGISDFPSNFDYCFRAGIFCGDYNAVAVTENDTKAYAFWTDARNGRSSGGPAGEPTRPSQPGRNPICEQSDVMLEEYATESPAGGQQQPRREDRMFLVTPCPTDAQEP